MFTPLRDINMPAIEIVKRPRKRGRPLTYEEKWMVQHVFEKFQHNKKEKSTVIVEDPYSMTSEYTGVSRTTVSNIVKSVKDTGTVPKLTFPGNRCQQPTISVSVEERIRDFIFDKHRMGAICNANHIVHLLKREFNLEVHERTVRRHLQRMGFCWSRTKHKPRSLRESNKVRQQRHDYLYEIKKNRSLPVEKQYKVVYLDESFLHHHHGAQFSWLTSGDFIERSLGKGRRWCFIHAVMEDSLVNNAFFIFEAKKAKADYHQQFDFEVFHTWFQKQLLPNIPSRCLIILDRCPFHMVSKDYTTPTQMKKAELQKWLTRQGIHLEEKWLRPRLVEEVEEIRDKKPMVEILAEEQGHRTLFLPVHHPELNPIELVWATAKNQCASLFSNTTSFNEQRENLEKAFQEKINLIYCSKVFDDIRKIEEKYWEADLAIDDELEIEEESL
jgi:transposase